MHKPCKLKCVPVDRCYYSAKPWANNNYDGKKSSHYQGHVIKYTRCAGNIGHECQVNRVIVRVLGCLFASRLSCVQAGAGLIGALVQRSAEKLPETWDRKALQNRENRYGTKHRMPNMHSWQKRQDGKIWLGPAPSIVTLDMTVTGSQEIFQA